MRCSICGTQIAPGQDICTSCWETKSRLVGNKVEESNMYYFVLTSPESVTTVCSLYFKDKLEAIEYAKSVEKYNPKIVEYDTNKDNTLMYDNLMYFSNLTHK